MFDGILQPGHLVVLLAVVLLIYGPKRLPEVGRAVGRGIREFKGSLSDHAGSQRADTREPPPPSNESGRRERALAARHALPPDR